MRASRGDRTDWHHPATLFTATARVSSSPHVATQAFSVHATHGGALAARNESRHNNTDSVGIRCHEFTGLLPGQDVRVCTNAISPHRGFGDRTRCLEPEDTGLCCASTSFLATHRCIDKRKTNPPRAPSFNGIFRAADAQKTPCWKAPRARGDSCNNRSEVSHISPPLFFSNRSKGTSNPDNSRHPTACRSKNNTHLHTTCLTRSATHIKSGLLHECKLVNLARLKAPPPLSFHPTDRPRTDKITPPVHALAPSD